MLTVGALTYTTETMTFYNTLESFTLGCADYIDKTTLLKKIHCECLTQ